MGQDEMPSIEGVQLSELVRKGKKVMIIFTTGYQANAVITDFDECVIIANVKDQEWMIYRNAISTIILDGGSYAGK